MSVVDYIAALDRPSYAPSFNGTYLEELIPGYRTLDVSGRDNLENDIDEITLYAVNGARLKNKRITTRSISITFALVRETPEDIRIALNELRGFLFGQDMKDVKLIFDDENDKYFHGTVVSIDAAKIVNLDDAAGTINFQCSDPFKYSVQEYEVVPDPEAEDSDTFIVDYHGTYKSYPTLQADFYQSTSEDNKDGDCGFVAFMNENEKILQFGNPDEGNTESKKYTKVIKGDTTTWYTKERLVTAEFKTSQPGWSSNTGIKTYAPDQAFAGSMAINKFPDSSVVGENSLNVSNYGSGSKLHGPSILKVIPNDSKGRSEAKDWTVQYKFRFACSYNAKKAKSCVGAQQCLIWNHSNNKIIAGVEFYKNKTGTRGVLSCIVNGTKVKTWDVDMSVHNNIAGWGRSANKKKKWIALRRGPSTVTITKSGSTITFTIPYRNKDGQKYDQRLQYSCKNTAVQDVVATRLQFNFFKYGTKEPVYSNGLYWVHFNSNSVLNQKTEYTTEVLTRVINIENTFSTNDSLIADVPTAEVYLNDDRQPGLGALGNDWEEFYLTPGINQIHCSYSDWVTDTYKPTFKMRYREVFL